MDDSPRAGGGTRANDQTGGHQVQNRNLSRRTISIAGAALAVLGLVLGIVLSLGGGPTATPTSAAEILSEIGRFHEDGYLCDRVQGFTQPSGTTFAADGVIDFAQDWLPKGDSLPDAGGLFCATAYLVRGPALPTAQEMDAIPAVHGAHWFISLGAPVSHAVLQQILQRTGGSLG